LMLIQRYQAYLSMWNQEEVKKEHVSVFCMFAHFLTFQTEKHIWLYQSKIQRKDECLLHITRKFVYIFKKKIYNLGVHSFTSKPEIDKTTHCRMI